jgi:hypothetical protein
VTLLRAIGRGVEVNAIQMPAMAEAFNELRERQERRRAKPRRSDAAKNGLA